MNTEALRRAHAATTQGEWRWHQGHSVCAVRADGRDIAVTVGAAYWETAAPEQAANAHFIALAHKEVPALCDRVDALEAALRGLLEMPGDVDTECNPPEMQAEVLAKRRAAWSNARAALGEQS